MNPLIKFTSGGRFTFPPSQDPARSLLSVDAAMTTIYKLGYVRELDHIPDEPLTVVSKQDLAPVWSNERREQQRPVTAGASRKQAFARLTALLLAERAEHVALGAR